MKTIYIGCPYTGTEEYSYTEVTKYASKLMLQGYRVFSPITHSHPIYNSNFEAFNNIEDEHAFWLNQDLHFMKSCDMMHVLCLDGWENSEGLFKEVAYAKSLGIQVVNIRWW